MNEIVGAKPFFGGKKRIDKILKNIEQVLESGNLSLGDYTKSFEERMTELVGGKYAVSVSSGGSALELTLQSLNLNGREVIVPTDTFVATANAVIKAGGIPVFADINKENLCLDPNSALHLVSDKTAGIIYVHMFGLIPKSFLKVREICQSNDLFLIEDSAHAHGSKLGKENAGNLADAGCFSFYATKILTSGEGGAITTNDKKLYDSLISLRNHGRKLGSNLYDRVSNNYRMPEISCLLAFHQLEIIDDIIKSRRNIASQYSGELTDVDGLEILNEFNGNNDCSYWRYPIYIDERLDRQELQNRMMKNHKICITWMYEPLCHMQPVFKEFVSSNYKLDEAEECIKRLVCIPCYPDLSKEDVSRVCSGIKDELGKMKVKNL